jgi:succinate dehydrogenase hydrophobic anchor subunit
MKDPEESQGTHVPSLPILAMLPVLSHYAKTRGWHYIISWLHRFAGIGLIIILIVHMYILSSLQTADVDYARMKVIASSIFLLLAWAASLVVGFHALNGGRLILYELFGRRDDAEMIRWIFGLSAAYAAIVGLMMLMKNQHVSAFIFWLMALFLGAIAAYAVASRLWKKRHSVLWKLQRISGAFLLITVPAYLLYSYLNPGEASGAQAAVVWMQSVFTRLVFLTIATCALYHAGYGLFSIAADYISPGITRAGMTALILVAIAVLAVSAFRLILLV